jgi:hypothetical protein
LFLPDLVEVAMARLGHPELMRSAINFDFSFAGADWPQCHAVQKSVMNDQRVE